ncbi:glycosyltransferase family 9 protein [Conexibacter arvalis]|uniref:ADP-heptose:LPS heptosyltransferase n=1 Tax=Conexibacter arvalis TaxID=912552 RepID=A0A840IBI8_9ACTN|nr:glycosyltransferase family 9 protein [Conexibacter arvalis]MBB4662287.1 ADP-heptose:LPS heptosyltransferase [Conexibacter arvalis]
MTARPDRDRRHAAPAPAATPTATGPAPPRTVADPADTARPRPIGGRTADRPQRPHVLVARLDNDGDVLLAGPAIRAVAANAGRVTLLCGPRGQAAAELLPCVDELLLHRAEWIDPEPEPFDPAHSHRLVREVAARPVDEAVIFTSFHQSPLPLALLLRLAGVPRIAATSVDYPGSLLDVRHRISDDVHEVERALGLAAAAGHPLPPGDDGALRILRRSAGTALPPALPPQPYVVVHPGASVSARAWAPERHEQLVAALTERGRAVVVTGSPDERELTARVAAAAPVRAVDLGGATDLAGLAEVIAGAEAIVVGNTGPAHLAAAVGTPVVSLYAPTVPAVRWRPWMVPHVILHEPVPCAGCRARDCPVPGHPCIDRLPLATVLDAVDAMAAAERPHRPPLPAPEPPAPRPPSRPDRHGRPARTARRGNGSTRQRGATA